MISDPFDNQTSPYQTGGKSQKYNSYANDWKSSLLHDRVGQCAEQH